ncbi:hypothetical protein N7493_007335 [Penicillium malachiteum]|uniref:Galactose oxidase-like Early set domain-containing protein n=1 Tax=Penicillium malachiteum TaxID=1324776 RepID=A0AAD6MUQ6_9EURO|nr:hypothetical protein N7493_007335 [Penicillium malachiteum]
MSELEALYTEGTTPDTANIGDLQVSTLSHETTDHECDKAIDDPTTSFWLSAQTNTSQRITIKLSDKEKIHEVTLSLDGKHWETVAYGTWWPDTSQKVSSFQPKKAKFLRLSGPAPNGISIADIRVYETEFIEPNPAGGAWGTTIDFLLYPSPVPLIRFLEMSLSDKHGWLFTWTGGSVFQAGPSKEMNWYGTPDTGTTAPAGTRTCDGDAMGGNAVMYDKGKILAFGGSKYYETTEATKYAAIISIDQPDEPANVLQDAGGGMKYERTFHSSVVLPDGSTFVNGGQVVTLLFDESQPQLTPEIFVPDPTNNQDGTVLTGGGGLCGSCDSNHFDGQIYTPSYLLNTDGSSRVRPVIESASQNAVKPGDTVQITTDGPVNAEASIIRYGSTTHTVNTDQRRISVQLSSIGSNAYTFDIPSEPGIALPGYYMLFVLNNDGAPSHSVNIQVTV